MLEPTGHAGSGRSLRLTHGDAAVDTPALIVPATTRGMPDGTQIALVKERTGVAPVEIVSGGTWFHPRHVADGPSSPEDPPADPGLVIRPPQPGPTDRVQVLHVGDDLAVFHDAAGWNADPKRFVPALIDAARQAKAKALYAPGLGSPGDAAVYACIGVDLFDASVPMLAAVRGDALTPDGPMPQDAARAVYGEQADDLWTFNIRQMQEELARVRHAVQQGTLRQLAERRAALRPDVVAMLRRFDREHRHLESRSPVHDHRPVPCMTWDSLWMPEVERFRRRFRDDYTPPPADVLVLLPCSARKPYRRSRTHRYFQRALDDSGARHSVHEVMVTSPLGLVPRDLEDTYPAAQYDVPVTGHWNRDEEAIIRQQLTALLDKGGYRHVIAHVPASTFTFIRDLLPENALRTAHGRPSGMEDCNRLRDALRAIRDAPGDAPPTSGTPAGHPFAGAKARKVPDLRGLLSMQFGAEAAARLTRGATARGRVPFVKLFDPDGTQLGQTTEKGLLSLTLDGARIVAGAGVKRVRIGDFEIRKTGSLFAAGVEGADLDVRPGEEVVVLHGEELRAVGQAKMTAAEMTHLRRGVAVSLRHIVKRAAATREVAA